MLIGSRCCLVLTCFFAVSNHMLDAERDFNQKPDPPAKEATKDEITPDSMDSMVPPTPRVAKTAADGPIDMQQRRQRQEADTKLSSRHVHNKSRGRGRARLPEKLMEHLNAEAAPDVLWWLPAEEAFAVESSRVQTELLDAHFRGTKLSSFIRSLNRW